MKVSLGVAAAVALAACGDNSNLCGPGTVDIAGTCTGVTSCGPGTMDDGSGTCVPTCAAGTVLDPTSGSCVVDPQDCHDGTVLVGNTCVDPAHGLTVDVEEGAEPNGIGVLGIENSLLPAGLVTLKPTGQTTVIHGHIAATDHNSDGQRDPDLDAFVVTVAKPTLVHLTATGLGGLAAAFYVAPMNRPAGDILGGKWQRFGFNHGGSSEARDLYLPDAGTYAIGIADSQTLVANLAVGDTPLEYYVSATVMDVPAPAPMPASGVATGTLGQGETRFFAAPMGTGINDVKLVAPQFIQVNDGVDGAVTVASADGTFRNTASELFFNAAGGTSSIAAELGEGGFKTGEQALIVVDMESDVQLDPSPFTLTVKTYDSIPVPTSGAFSPPLVSGALPFPAIGENYFEIDVTKAGQVDDLALHFDKPTEMVLLDQHFRVISYMTWLQGHPSGFTTSGYSGLIRFPIPNVYYIGAYTFLGTTGEPMTGTGSLKVLDVPDGTDGATFMSTQVATYTAIAPWQRFELPNNVGADFYNTDDAYGLLDPITVKTDGGTFSYPPVFQPMFSGTGGPVSRIVLDDASQKYFVRFHATGAFSTTFRKEDYTDLGTPNPGPITLATAGNYFMKPNIGEPLVFAQPVDFLNADTTVAQTTATFFPSKSWAAFVSPVNMLTVEPVVTYTMTTNTGATFTEICDGTNKIGMRGDWGDLDDLAINSDFAPPINAPANFHYFGAPVGALAVADDGWIGFDYQFAQDVLNNNDPTISAANNPIGMSGSLFGLVSPYWDDLHKVVACQKSTATTLTIEWTGETVADHKAVRFQVILDATNDSITFVYDAAHKATCTGATIGIESPTGASGNQFCYDNDGKLNAPTSIVFTPN